MAPFYRRGNPNTERLMSRSLSKSMAGLGYKPGCLTSGLEKPVRHTAVSHSSSWRTQRGCWFLSSFLPGSEGSHTALSYIRDTQYPGH